MKLKHCLGDSQVYLTRCKAAGGMPQGLGQRQHAPLRRCATPSKSLSGVGDLNSRPPCAEGSLLPPLLSEKLSNSLPATSKSPMPGGTTQPAAWWHLPLMRCVKVRCAKPARSGPGMSAAQPQCFRSTAQFFQQACDGTAGQTYK